MHRSTFVTTVAILATTALAGRADAQISGTIGGDIVATGAPHMGGLGATSPLTPPMVAWTRS